MIKPEQVPKEVVDAFWQHFQDNKSTDGAIAAALNAWPHMIDAPEDFDRWRLNCRCIILPLPTEASDEQ